MTEFTKRAWKKFGAHCEALRSSRYSHLVWDWRWPAKETGFVRTFVAGKPVTEQDWYEFAFTNTEVTR